MEIPNDRITWVEVDAREARRGVEALTRSANIMSETIKKMDAEIRDLQRVVISLLAKQIKEEDKE